MEIVSSLYRLNLYFQENISTINRLIQVYANNILKNKTLFRSNHYKLLTNSISICYLFNHIRSIFLFFCFFDLILTKVMLVLEMLKF